MSITYTSDDNNNLYLRPPSCSIVQGHNVVFVQGHNVLFVQGICGHINIIFSFKKVLKLSFFL